MSEIMVSRVDEMVNLNLLSYHKGMQDALNTIADRLTETRDAINGRNLDSTIPYVEGINESLRHAQTVVFQLRTASAKLCHESRGEHECDEYCPPSF